MLGSNPYVCRSYSGKTIRESFCRVAEFIQNFQKGETYLIGEIFVGKKFSLGKFLSPSQYSVTIARRKF